MKSRGRASAKERLPRSSAWPASACLAASLPTRPALFRRHVCAADRAGPGRVAESRKAQPGEASAPLGHRLPAHLVALGNLLALVAPGAIQDDARPYVQARFRVAAPAPLLQGLLPVFVQYDLNRYAAHLMLLASRITSGLSQASIR